MKGILLRGAMTLGCLLLAAPAFGQVIYTTTYRPAPPIPLCVYVPAEVSPGYRLVAPLPRPIRLHDGKPISSAKEAKPKTTGVVAKKTVTPVRK